MFCNILISFLLFYVICGTLKSKVKTKIDGDRAGDIMQLAKSTRVIAYRAILTGEQQIAEPFPQSYAIAS